MNYRFAACLILVLCLVPFAGATPIPAGDAGCNAGGGGSCYGPYALGGDVKTLTFDYSVANSAIKNLVSLDNVAVGLGVWDTNGGNDTSNKSFTIDLLIGSSVWTVRTIGGTLEGYKSANRDFITATLLDSSELASFLTALQGTKGKFSVEIIAADDSGSFNVGTQDRFATLDFIAPEPASLGLAGIGLVALCWSLRRKIRNRA
jgi:hypothetical protein